MYEVVGRYLQLDQGFLKRGEHAKIAAARAPVGIDCLSDPPCSVGWHAVHATVDNGFHTDKRIQIAFA